MAINFPNNPVVNETYAVGSVTWTWDGVSWVAQGSGSSGGGGGSNVDLTSFSVSTGAASAGGSLSYSASTGVFTFRPTDTTTFLTGSTGVTPGTYGDANNIPQLTVNADGQITAISTNSTSGGGGVAAVERFKLNYSSDGTLSSITDATIGIGSTNIDSATGGEVTITFDSGIYNYPPLSVIMYGYDYTNNNYVISPLESTMTKRTVLAGGTSGSPTLFDGADTVEVQLRLREAETAASRGGFGTVTHAWIQFVLAG